MAWPWFRIECLPIHMVIIFDLTTHSTHSPHAHTKTHTNTHTKISQAYGTSKIQSIATTRRCSFCPRVFQWLWHISNTFIIYHSPLMFMCIDSTADTHDANHNHSRQGISNEKFSRLNQISIKCCNRLNHQIEILLYFSHDNNIERLTKLIDIK